jgi:hypothetical protein
MADTLEVSLDYLVGNPNLLLDKTLLKRIPDIQQLPDEDKAHLNTLMDAFLRDQNLKKLITHKIQKPRMGLCCL